MTDKDVLVGIYHKFLEKLTMIWQCQHKFKYIFFFIANKLNL